MLPGMDAKNLPCRRVYGSDPGDSHAGPHPGHDYRELVGGPLDGQLLDVTGWSAEELAEGRC